MRKRLALVMCTKPHEGAWSRVKGNELGVRVSPLEMGECVRLDMVRDDGKVVSNYYVKAGAHPHPDLAKATRYRFVKVANEGAILTPTTVEVLLHG